MGINCAPLLADLFLYWYDADFIPGLLMKNEKKLARSFNFTFCYIDVVLSLNNSRFGDFVDRIYPIELEIKDTTNTYKSASNLDLHLNIVREIYTPYTGAAGMFLHINGTFAMGKLKSSLLS
jgi:hypothetical protein